MIPQRYIQHFMEILGKRPDHRISAAQLLAEWPYEYLQAARRCIKLGYARKGATGKHLKTFIATAKGLAYLKALTGNWEDIKLLQRP